MSTVKVGAHRYGIRRDSARLADDDAWGEHDSRRRVLHVDTRERPDSAVAEDLAHELLHACFLDAGHDGKKLTEERVCEILAPRITAFLEDNFPAAITHLAGLCRPDAE